MWGFPVAFLSLLYLRTPQTFGTGPTEQERPKAVVVLEALGEPCLINPEVTGPPGVFFEVLQANNLPLTSSPRAEHQCPRPPVVIAKTFSCQKLCCSKFRLQYHRSQFPSNSWG